jgi:hypothetical protein
MSDSQPFARLRVHPSEEPRTTKATDSKVA